MGGSSPTVTLYLSIDVNPQITGLPASADGLPMTAREHNDYGSPASSLLRP
jgi:hypothetical protein